MYQIYDEKCCGQKKPAALDVKPYFSWRLKCDGRGVSQAYYQIKLWNRGRLVWDSGAVESENTHNLPYGGPALSSSEDYLWSVTSISDRGETASGGVNLFSTGILDGNLWSAKWIGSPAERKPCDDETESWKIFTGEMPYYEHPEERLNPATYFRGEFRTSGRPVRARAYVTAHGIYEFYVNGDVYGTPLAPGYTVYREYMEYQAYDVTESIRDGVNVMGAIVADGWYMGKIGLLGIGNQYGDEPALFVQLLVEYEDGSTEVFGTDESFTAGTGAYMYADLFVGEGVDASKEPDGWLAPSFDDPSWGRAVLKDYGYSALRGSIDEPAACVRVQPPKRIFISPAGELIVDAGENIAGYISIKAFGKKGARVKLEACEVLDEHGNFLRNILGQNKNQTDVYLPASDGEFYYRPKFTFHGFQYVRISGLEPDDIKEVKVFVLASDMERTGWFECSDERLNQLQANIFRSQQGNMLYVPTDCPQRERAGWTGDMQAYSPTAAYLMDVEAFLRKWLANMRIEQWEDGMIPHTVPDMDSGKYMNGPGEECSSGWADACVIIPYRLYRAYGDSEILRENYDMMLRWMAYVEEKAASGIPEGAGELSKESLEYQKYLWNTGFHFGDWLIPSLSRDGVESPLDGAAKTREYIAPAMYAYTTKLMTEISAALGDKENADRFAFINKKIREAYAHEYMTPDGLLKAEYQGVYVLALAFDLVPDGARGGILEHLIGMIRDNGGCLDTGFLSMPFLLDVLCDNGRTDEAYRLLFQEKCPSWLYEIRHGANTIWESWTNISEDGIPGKSSYNHFAFGCVGDFMYRHILGLQILEPGYRKVRIAPDTDSGITWAKGSFESVYGRIQISWSRSGGAALSAADAEGDSASGRAVLDIGLPPGVSAVIEFGGKVMEVGSGSRHIEV